MFEQRAAFRRAVFGMGVVVVKASAVAQNQIASDGARRKTPLRILNEIICFVMILQQLFDPESTGIAMRIFTLIVPPPTHTRSGSRSDKRDGFAHDVESIRTFSTNADLALSAELNIESLLHAACVVLTSRTVGFE